MSTSTTRLNATKPASSENVSITVLNNNFDLFDAAVGTTVASAASKPASAFSGRLWYETDTSRFKVNIAASASAAAAWREIASPLDADTVYLPDYGLTAAGSASNSVAGSAAYAVVAAAADSSQSAYFGSNLRGTKIIKVPAGTYVFTSHGSLLHDRATSRTTGLTFVGAGRDVTNIVFAPATSAAYLLDNNDDWLHVTFQDMTFHGAGVGASANFMKTTSSGGAQNYVFNRVNWSGVWRYGIDMQGTNTNSEMSWWHCGFGADWNTYLYSASAGSDQFLNYNFFGCQIEYSSGNFVDMAKGGNINVWGGSLIHTGASASEQIFFRLRDGDHASGVQRLNVTGARVEHRHQSSVLIDSDWKRGSIQFTSVDTDTYSTLLTGASAVTTARFRGVNDTLPIIVWDGCTLMGKHSYQFEASSYDDARVVDYRDCEIENHSSAHDFISTVNSGSTSNLGSTIPITFDRCRTNLPSDSAQYPFDCTVNWHLARMAKPREYRVSIKKPEGGLPFAAATTEEVWLPLNAIITNVRFYMPAAGSSTATTWTYTLKDATPTTIATANPGTQWLNGFNVSTDTWFVCSTDTKRHLTLTSTVIDQQSATALCVVTYIA